MSRKWIRAGIVMIAITELAMLPYTFVFGWWIAAIIPAVVAAIVVGVGIFAWALDHAVRWIEGADR